MVLLIDPTERAGSVVGSCQLSSDTMDVVDPAVAPEFAEHFRHRSRARLGLGPEDDGDLSVIDLGDRQAYLWIVPAVVKGEAIRIVALYTTWNQTGLDCVATLHEGHQVSEEAVVQTYSTVRVKGGESKPMHRSLYARYRVAWPFHHPALEAWWLLLATLLAASAWRRRRSG
jgi:hypothetical protein